MNCQVFIETCTDLGAKLRSTDPKQHSPLILKLIRVQEFVGQFVRESHQPDVAPRDRLSTRFNPLYATLEAPAFAMGELELIAGQMVAAGIS